MARGRLRLYLGAAPGVGKTYAMLSEGWRRHERGTDVVIALVESHGRPNTAAQIRDLEVVPRKTIDYREQQFEEMDVDAVIARRPQVALVDELAHTNVPGSVNTKRWQDVEAILDAGIDVISTVNLQHLESVNDVVEKITGIAQRETVPDAEVRRADQIELVDMDPEALRRRLAHGNVYPAERIDAALANFFRPGNLAALRELALLWVADRVDDELQAYRERHGIEGPWETKERVAVSLTGAPGGDDLIRRAARMAARTKGELVAIHVRMDSGLAQGSSGAETMARHRALLEELGGRHVEVVGSDVPRALVQAALAENATQLIIGASRRSRWSHLVRGSVVSGAIKAAGGKLDVHVIGTVADRGRPPVPRSRPRRPLLSPVPPRRRLVGIGLGLIALPFATYVLTLMRTASHQDLATPLCVELLVVMAVAVIGGMEVGIAAAIAGFLLLNYFFTPPIHSFAINGVRDVVALVAFLVVAGAVSALVDLSARRALTAARATSDARALGRIAGRMVSTTDDPLPELLGELVATFHQRGVAVVQSTGGHWVVEASAGDQVPTTPAAAALTLPLTDNQLLVLGGPGLAAEDREVLAGFAAQLAAAIERRALHSGAAEADELARAGELRTALLAAVSHDLRTPLASIKAATTSLLAGDVAFSPEQTTALLETMDGEADRLAALVENLLDMSRVQTGSVEVTAADTPLDTVVEGALSTLGPRSTQVDVDVARELPRVHADPVLLERVVANLVDNALVHGCSGADRRRIRVEAGAVGGRVLLRVIDRGPGIRPSEKDQVFEAFQRLGDSSGRPGVGLGLAVARGFVDAMGGELTPEDTPGGGCTMVVSLPMGAGPTDGPGPVGARSRPGDALPPPAGQAEPAAPAPSATTP